MNGHYFSEHPSSSGKKTIIQTVQFNQSLSFKSQSGIFNWQKVDTGSELLLEKSRLPNNSGAEILDLGCGYGLLGIAIAKACPTVKVTLTDINRLAVRLAKENCKRNRVEKNTAVKKGHLYEPVKKQLFDLIITNPPISAGKKVLRELTAKAPPHLKPEGSLQLVVPKKKGLGSMKKMLKEAFGTWEVLGKGSGFWVLKAPGKES
ncbi:MAG: methyltransferase [Candidatus Heimdallarchaeota archaeon]|nr:methyltransferase [Candidatus Heimdallarchaeota archaeon]